MITPNVVFLNELQVIFVLKKAGILEHLTHKKNVLPVHEMTFYMHYSINRVVVSIKETETSEVYEINAPLDSVTYIKY